MTTLHAKQTKQYGPAPISGYGAGAIIIATVRFDDECRNGHNTFSVTATISTPRSRSRGDIEAGGMLHEDVSRAFPALAPYLRWHLVSTDGPMHYIENTMYWLGRRGWMNKRPGDPPNLAHARKGAVWPDMPEAYLITGTHVSNQAVEDALKARLPALLQEFRAAVESLGLVW